MRTDRHAVSVGLWLERAAEDATPDLLFRRFQAAFSAVWRRTMDTLGEVTLNAIADRVMHNAIEKFPSFATLRVDLSGELHAEEIRPDLASRSEDELKQLISYVLVEYLSVIGNLTADILTSDLHAELSTVELKVEE